MHLVTGTKKETASLEGGSPKAIYGLAGWMLEALRRAKVGSWIGESASERKQMFVVERLILGPKKQLLLVSCAGERYLVGTGSESIQTIVKVSSEKAGKSLTRVKGDSECI